MSTTQPATTGNSTAAATASVVTATIAHRPQVVDALASAFYHDPVFAWLCPDDDRRRTALPGWFGAIADGLRHHGATFVTTDGTGAALWVPPGEPMVTDPQAFGAAVMAVSPPDAERFGTMMALLDEHHPEEPHWYLFLVGVLASHQGKGVGSLLLRAVLDRCDGEGMPAYLEATCDRNCRLYERHGFQVVRELQLPDGPKGFAMWREPAPSAR